MGRPRTEGKNGRAKNENLKGGKDIQERRDLCGLLFFLNGF
jgi:hypothetical protein